MPPEIILASSSPRRKLLLRQIGLPFKIITAQMDEAVDPSADPAITVETLARRKAETVARSPELDSDYALIIAADTVVFHNDRILGKPSGPPEAVSMLQSLSGQTHSVYTGVAWVLAGTVPGTVRLKARHYRFFECTDVTFGELTDEEIASYVESGSPLDKAGAYGIQDDLGAMFVEKINGDYYNVVGFPLFRFYHEVNKMLPGTVNPFKTTESQTLRK